mgnify:CR=1 FL=1
MRSTRRSQARCGQLQMNINVIWNDDAGHPEWGGETVTVHYRDSNPDDYLYMYLDESGNLDFKQSGTPFFLMTCVVATRPFNSADAMRELRYDLMEKGMDIQKFHACDDKNEVRKSVYRILSAQNCNYRVYSVYVDKSEVPDEMRTPESVYSKVFSLLLDEIYRAEGIINLEGIVVITDRLPKDATKRQVVKPLKRYEGEVPGPAYPLRPYAPRLGERHEPSGSGLLLLGGSTRPRPGQALANVRRLSVFQKGRKS